MSRWASLPVLDTTPQFDPGRATNAYLARVSGAAREKSDSYTDGGYFWSWSIFFMGW